MTAVHRRPRRCRALRSLFTEEQFERQHRFFWALPAAWGNQDNDVLRRLYRLGGPGAVSLLPILGSYAHSDMAGKVPLSLEECARLSGSDATTIQRGASAFNDLKLASRTLHQRHGQTVTVWSVSKAIAAVLENGHIESGSFRFASSLVYGGTWSMLTAAQRAVYLAVATKAYTYSPVDGLAMLRDLVREGTDLSDAKQLTETDGAALPGKLRIAEVSGSELSAILGMSSTAVHGAVNRFKEARLWPSSLVPMVEAEHAPLAVYPTPPGRSNVFFFRDHAARWPLDVLNRKALP